MEVDFTKDEVNYIYFFKEIECMQKMKGCEFVV